MQATKTAAKTHYDEFPFNATLEGTASLKWDYSVVYVNETENRAAGGLMSHFMAYCRILDNDPFWVRIKSGSPPAQ
ncbi:NucA/NucB deoxyribonuclease domain-containing protein [Nonomuraea diastatica]|uniref:NucA/NucB deoxyribonuclease domain-containing protein n=1 Tax=Nonomuraea diastatica TaxID=1848329 RepID=UPI00140C35A7